jgi:DNA-binding transcriptional MerR regulator
MSDSHFRFRLLASVATNSRIFFENNRLTTSAMSLGIAELIRIGQALGLALKEIAALMEKRRKGKLPLKGRIEMMRAQLAKLDVKAIELERLPRPPVRPDELTFCGALLALAPSTVLLLESVRIPFTLNSPASVGEVA